MLPKAKTRLTLAIAHIVHIVGRRTRSTSRLRRAQDDRIISMGLDVFLQVLGSFECFSTEFAFVRLERDMYSDVGGNVVAFDGGGATSSPLASQVEIVCALASDVTFTDVVLVKVRL